MRKYLILLLLFLIPINVFASESSIDDKANILDENTKNILQSTIKTFSDNKNINLYVVSTNDLENKTEEEYANNYLNNDKSTSIILLLYNNKIYLYGYGNIDKYYDDLNKCLDNNNNNFISINLISTINNLNYYYKDNTSTNNLNNDIIQYKSFIITKDELITILIISLIISLLISTGIIIALVLSSNLVIPDSGACNFLNNNTVKTNVIFDRIIGSSTSRSKKMNSDKD